MMHRTVNLAILATANDGKNCSNETRYRRLQDFFLNFDLPLDSVGKLILKRIPKPPKGFLLALDRTNWDFGRKSINFLAFSIVVGKVSIPIVWKVLPKSTRNGNSNTKQRIALTKKLFRLIPAREIHALTMDREFSGKAWLQFLKENNVPYVSRIRRSTLVDGKPAIKQAKTKGRRKQHRRKIYDFELFFGSKVMSKKGRDTHLMVISNRFQAKEALEIYRQRWGIERLFGHLKKKGFDLEATHMTDGKKLEKLFAIVSLAFVFSFGWGCHLRQTGQKTSSQSKRKSLFRLGLEDILSLLNRHPNKEKTDLRRSQLLQWLANPSLNTIFLV